MAVSVRELVGPLRDVAPVSIEGKNWDVGACIHVKGLVYFRAPTFCPDIAALVYDNRGKSFGVQCSGVRASEYFRRF